MANYAVTVTLDQRSAAKFGNGGFKLIAGQVALSNYNSTPAEITGITGEFKTLLRVVCDGVSSGGYLVRWSKTDKALKAYYPTKAATAAFAGEIYTPAGTISGATISALSFTGTAHTLAGTITVTAAAGTEVANDVNVGTVNFLAFGL